jgi:predicted nucleic acid-binding protein
LQTTRVYETDERRHGWACEQFAQIKDVLVTCESVLREAFHILRTLPRHRATFRRMLHEHFFDLSFLLAKEGSAVARWMEQYRDVRLSLADGCLVRLSELRPAMPVLTLDADFRFYRCNQRRQLAVIAPR